MSKMTTTISLACFWKTSVPCRPSHGLQHAKAKNSSKRLLPRALPGRRRSRALGPARGSSRPRARGASRSPHWPGKNTLNVVPLPGLEYTLIAPLWPRTMPKTAASPNPRPVNLVLKNGSKMRCLVLRPCRTRCRALPGTRRYRCRCLPWKTSSARKTRRSPACRWSRAPCRVDRRWLRAVDHEFITICCTCAMSAEIAGRS